MQPDNSWYRYKGDGSTPPGVTYDSRGEKGRYLAAPDLVTAVNTALTVEQPLLVVGESGTGKTMLAWSIASELGHLPVLHFHTRSDHRARDVLFSIDNLRRFYDAQIEDERARDLTNPGLIFLRRRVDCRDPRRLRSVKTASPWKGTTTARANASVSRPLRPTRRSTRLSSSTTSAVHRIEGARHTLDAG